MKIVLFAIAFLLLAPALVLSDEVSVDDYDAGSYSLYNIQEFETPTSINNFQTKTFIDSSHFRKQSTFHDHGTKSFYDVSQTDKRIYTDFDYRKKTFRITP